MKKLSHVLFFGIMEFLAIPLKIACTLFFIVSAVYFQIRDKFDKEDWQDIFDDIGRMYDRYYAAWFDYIETGVFDF